MTPIVSMLQICEHGRDFVLLAFATGPQVPKESIVGRAELVDGQPRWGAFTRNVGFVEQFVRYMQGEGPVRPRLLADARVEPGQYVYAIDRRADRKGGDVPFSDVIGWYRSTADGRAEPGTFEYNAEHALVTADGQPSSILCDPQVRAALCAAPPSRPR